MAKLKNVAVDIKQLTKKKSKKEILSPIDYQLESGKILALCGGNGAGKSTLIRLITGLIQSTTGEVSINGYTKRQAKSEFINQFGYMPDDFEFQKSMTAKETIQFYARLNMIRNSRINDVNKEVSFLDKIK